MIKRWWLVCVSGIIAVLPPSGQQLGQQPASQPTFKTGAEVVLVDFMVSDKNNQPVRGLTASDFVVKEDGKERPIVSFAAFNARDTASASAPAAAATTVAASSGLATQPLDATPATVLLIDDGHFTPQHVVWVRPALKELLATMSKRGGTVEMIAPWSKVSVAARFPDQAAAFYEGIDKIVGQRFEDRSSFPISDSEAIAVEGGDSGVLTRITSRFVALNPTVPVESAAGLAHNRAVEVAHDARQRRDVLYGIGGLALDWLAKQPGRRGLVVVSPGFPRDPDDHRYQQMVTRSMQLNAPIHFVDVRGLQGMGLASVQYRAGLDQNAGAAPFTWSDDAAGAATLAEETGGITIQNNNDIATALASVVESMSSYYVIGYEPPAHLKPGFKKITVETKARGVRVRARKGYYVVPSPPPPPTPPK